MIQAILVKRLSHDSGCYAAGIFERCGLTLQHECFILQPVEFVREDEETEKCGQRNGYRKAVSEGFGSQLQRGNGEQQVGYKKTCRNDQHFPPGVEIKKYVEYRHQQHLHTDCNHIDIKQMNVERGYANGLQQAPAPQKAQHHRQTLHFEDFVDALSGSVQIFLFSPVLNLPSNRYRPFSEPVAISSLAYSAAGADSTFKLCGNHRKPDSACSACCARSAFLSPFMLCAFCGDTASATIVRMQSLLTCDR